MVNKLSKCKRGKISPSARRTDTPVLTAVHTAGAM